MTVSENEIAIQFLANLINDRECGRKGYTMAVRWLCLRDDLQKQYLDEAKKIVRGWWESEKRAEASRHQSDPLSQYDEVTR